MFPECPLLFYCFVNKVQNHCYTNCSLLTRFLHMFFTPCPIGMRILGVKLFLVNVNQDGMSVFKYVVMVTVVLCDSTWPQNAGAWSQSLQMNSLLTHASCQPSAEGSGVKTWKRYRPLNIYSCTEFTSMSNTHTSYARGSGYKLGRLLRPRIFCSHSKKSRDYLNYDAPASYLILPEIHYSPKIPTFNANLRWCSIVK
jgi:hypothetical protein